MNIYDFISLIFVLTISWAHHSLLLFLQFQIWVVCKIKCNMRICSEDLVRPPERIVVAEPFDDDIKVLLPEKAKTMPLPRGYKFKPILYELFPHCLRVKEDGNTELIPFTHVVDADVYGTEPWILTGIHF